MLDNILQIEAETWLIEDDEKRNEKFQREVCRYPYMARLMGLGYIDTSTMVVVDIGGGPIGLSSSIPHKKRIVIDPLTDEYKKFYPCLNHITGIGEELPFEDESIDLVIITNALDHTKEPLKVIREIKRVLKPGYFFAQYHAIDNSITHRHPAHEHSLNPEWLHEQLDDEFETVWELKYPEVRYGWHFYNGKVGQPAWCGLYRKVTGYKPDDGYCHDRKCPLWIGGAAI